MKRELQRTFSVTDDAFRAALRAFFDARRSFVEMRHTDVPSIESAVEEMATHLGELRRLVTGTRSGWVSRAGSSSPRR